MVNNIVLIGASSELAQEFAKTCSKNNLNVYLISRSTIGNNNSRNLQINDYIDDINTIIEFVDKINSCYVMFFNGVLFENRPIRIPTKNEIKLTEDVNFKIPYVICKELNISLNNIEKFIFISSMACVVPRNKNFIYGNSKRKLEESIVNLRLSSFLILRFGKILTQMSLKHNNPPLTFTKNKASNLIYKNLNKNGIIYPHKGLKLIAIILKLIPKKLLSRINI